VQAQRARIAQGVPYQDGTTPSRLREVRTLVTLRVPLTDIAPTIPALLTTLLNLPSWSEMHLATRLASSLSTALGHMDGLRAGVEATLRTAGHSVTPLGGIALGHAIARTLDPAGTDAPVILPDMPLNEQVVGTDAVRVPGGWTLGDGLTAQVLSLHRAPPQTYPVILCAPRAPEGAQPLALWNAWAGPLSVVVNIAVVDQAAEKARLQFKRMLAGLHGKGSLENTALKDELDGLLRHFFLTGGHLLWGRVHIVLWGPDGLLPRGIEDVRRAGRRLDLEFLPEPTLGSTLFLHTLPWGLIPPGPPNGWSSVPGAYLGQILPTSCPSMGDFVAPRRPVSCISIIEGKP
jgi:hypothetical protein